MQIEWQTLFETWAAKTVSVTDKEKSAYVVSVPQRRILELVGIRPAHDRTFQIHVLDSTRNSVRASYYASRREGSGRKPEHRMGYEFIESWLEVGDEVIFGVIGGELVAAKGGVHSNTEMAARTLARSASTEYWMERARTQVKKGGRMKVTRDEFIRSPIVVIAVLARSKNRCEMPGCVRPLFLREDGSSYVEVHHILPLAEGGSDTIENAAALCPSCHREHHHGMDKVLLRKTLRAHVQARMLSLQTVRSRSTTG